MPSASPAAHGTLAPDARREPPWTCRTPDACRCTSRRGQAGAKRPRGAVRVTGIDGSGEILKGPYRIMFAVRDRDVVILSLLDSRRDLAELLIARALRRQD